MKTRMKPPYWDRAKTQLAAADGVLGALIARYPDVHLQRRGEPFTVLARAIVGAADLGQGRAVDLGSVCQGDGRERRPGAARRRPRRTHAHDDAAAGRPVERKACVLRDLARHFTSGALSPGEWPSLDDETLIARLVDVKGIGRVDRGDVPHLPRASAGRLSGRRHRACRRPSRCIIAMASACPWPTCRAFGERWAPYRSVATWYLWRSLDPIPSNY
jgi:DNA-3-methyladenine glycosylase II